MANPTPTPGEYKRDVGSGDALAYGEAADANESLTEGDALEEQLAAETQFVDPALLGGPPAVEYAEGDTDYQPADELEEVLFGPSEDLPTMPSPDRRPVPNSVIRALPQLAALAADPTTPASIKAAYRLLVQRLTAEMEARN